MANAATLATAEAALAALEAAHGDEREEGFRGEDAHREQMVAWRAAIDGLRIAADRGAMTNDQLERLLETIRPAGGAAAGGGGDGGKTKIQYLSKVDAQSWRGWRNHVSLVIQENGYALVNHDRAKRQVKIHITEKAEELTRDIQYVTAAEAADAGDPEETYEDFLDRLQLRFLPRSAQFAARTQFELSKQRPDESIGHFHARLVSEFYLAYPDTPNPEVDPHLMRKFSHGLKDAAVQAFVLQEEPETYADALSAAEAKYAVLQTVASCHKPGGGTITALEKRKGRELTDQMAQQFVAAVNKRMQTSGKEANKSLRRRDWEGQPVPNPGGKKCHRCGSEFHLLKECPIPVLTEGRKDSGGAGVDAVGRKAKKAAAGKDNAKRTRNRKKVGSIEEEESEQTDAATKMLAALLANTETTDADKEQ